MGGGVIWVQRHGRINHTHKASLGSHVQGGCERKRGGRRGRKGGSGVQRHGRIVHTKPHRFSCTRRV